MRSSQPLLLGISELCPFYLPIAQLEFEFRLSFFCTSLEAARALPIFSLASLGGLYIDWLKVSSWPSDRSLSFIEYS